MHHSIVPSLTSIIHLTLPMKICLQDSGNRRFKSLIINSGKHYAHLIIVTYWNEPKFSLLVHCSDVLGKTVAGHEGEMIITISVHYVL